MNKLSLKGIWDLRGEFMDVGADRFVEVMNREQGEYKVIQMGPNAFPFKTGFMKANVPCDVITPLMENGIIEEPFIKSNTQKCLWTRDLSWWFMRDFKVSQELYDNEEVRLFIEVLDFKADIIINGRPVAQHKNTFCAFNEDVKRFLKVGENKIIIIITSGIEDNYPKDSIAVYASSKFAVCDQRVYLRKPQFTYGWDWCPPVATCGIGGDIRLDGISGTVVSAFRADTLSVSDDKAVLNLFFELDNVSMCTADETTVEYIIECDGKVVHKDTKEYYLVGGLNFVNETVIIDNPKLWWPNGYGEQSLYTVTAKVTCRGLVNDMKPWRIGIRTIKIDHSKLDDGTRNFRFVVNGVNVFCKGGNWVPADSIYLRIKDETYKTLVEEAKNSNFTMLRIWGGGLYEPDCFYEYCSENGILIMHDFMYSCAYYPDNLDWFLHEATKEAEYQTKRLAHYPCMAVWTGNNEIHESYTDWFKGPLAADRYYGVKIFNYIQPKVVATNAPYTPYMPSSPYYGNRANSPYEGDIHAWGYFGNDPENKFKFKYELEAFDRIPARFSSEYGFFGTLKKSSVEKYLGDGDLLFTNPDWIHHGERVDKTNQIIEVLERHMIDTTDLNEEDYLLYGGIMQGCLYADMAEAMRIKPYGAGDLIWMYNDCWPETGWTTIDYYLTRKSSFYALKRAFEPVKLIIRPIKGTSTVSVTMLNETNKDIETTIEYGYMTFSGEVVSPQTKQVILKAHSYNNKCYEVQDSDLKTGIYYVKSLDNQGIDCATTLRPYFRDYEFILADMEITSITQDSSDIVVTVKSTNYVPIAYLEVADDRVKVSDNYFELVPNIEKTIRIYNCSDKPILKALRLEKKCEIN